MFQKKSNQTKCFAAFSGLCFFTNIFSKKKRFLKIYVLNITKRTKKATKRTCERYQYLPKKEKEKQQQKYRLE